MENDDVLRAIEEAEWSRERAASEKRLRRVERDLKARRRPGASYEGPLTWSDRNRLHYVMQVTRSAVALCAGLLDVEEFDVEEIARLKDAAGHVAVAANLVDEVVAAIAAEEDGWVEPPS